MDTLYYSPCHLNEEYTCNCDGSYTCDLCGETFTEDEIVEETVDYADEVL